MEGGDGPTGAAPEEEVGVISRTVTVTGVDNRTDLDQVAALQEKYPYAEFGFLLGVEGRRNGWRAGIDAVRSTNPIRMSAHLCNDYVQAFLSGRNPLAGSFGNG